jgi:two-component system, chemotaxis family, protein-glutamate methylesterase/glutaminase
VANAAEAVPEGLHDLIVVGASAGGVEALRRLVASLPETLPAAMLVVLHVPSNAHSVLPSILGRAGRLPVRHASSGEPIEPGVVYVAPPDFHLLVEDSKIDLIRGPSENGHRPAIDPLFRSAAASYGSRVIGVVLSGVLDDGTAGLLAITQAGGLTVVQDPSDALYSAMPRSAIENVPVDVVAPVDEIGDVLLRLVGHPRPAREEAPGPNGAPGPDVTKRALRGDGAYEVPGRPSRFTCPDCGGSLWETVEGEAKFRCRVGHSWTSLGLLERQSGTLEQALWTALRALAERADLARRLRDDAERRRHRHAHRLFEEQLNELEHSADLIRHVLQRPEPLARADVELADAVPLDAALDRTGNGD